MSKNLLVEQNRKENIDVHIGSAVHQEKHEKNFNISHNHLTTLATKGVWCFILKGLILEVIHFLIGMLCIFFYFIEIMISQRIPRLYTLKINE